MKRHIDVMVRYVADQLRKRMALIALTRRGRFHSTLDGAKADGHQHETLRRDAIFRGAIGSDMGLTGSKLHHHRHTALTLTPVRDRIRATLRALPQANRPCLRGHG